MKPSELQNSHAIASAFFRNIFRQNNGNAVVLKSKSKLRLSCNDSWATYQLCFSCEQLLNNKYENYSINALKGKNKEIKINRTELGVLFSKIDVFRVKCFILSVYLRGALSSHDSYNQLIITSEIKNNLRKVFLLNEKLLNQCYHAKISRLVNKLFDDPYKTHDLICSPFYRLKNITTDNKYNLIVFCFIFGGFFFELTLGRIWYKERINSGFLNCNSNNIFMNNIDMNDIPELKENMDYWYR